MTYVIINLDTHTSALNKLSYPLTPLRWKTFDPQRMLKETAFYFIINLFKVYLKIIPSIFFLWISWMVSWRTTTHSKIFLPGINAY
jgi:hypothetical protein